MQDRHKHNKYFIVQQSWAAIDSYMFRPLGGHHQVVLLKLKLIQLLISTSEEQPDDGHLKAETCSCQQQPNFAIQLNICCVYDGPIYLFLHCIRHTTGMSHLKIANITFCFKIGKTAMEKHEMSKTPCGNENYVSCSYLNRSKYLRGFGETLNMICRSGRQPTAQNPATVAKFANQWPERRSNDLEIEQRFTSFLVEVLEKGALHEERLKLSWVRSLRATFPGQSQRGEKPNALFT